ncbi:MAG: site-2 protease family protein [Christensenellales bacterium]|jgi:Zn-dependent protease
MIFNILRSGYSPSEMIILAMSVILAAILAIVSHEVAHGYIALKFGDPTAKLQGRLTLNPVAHFDLLGLALLLLVGFGWAKPVPINPNNFKNYRKGMIWVSAAGVIVNVLLGFVFLFLLYIFAPLIFKGTAFGSVYLLKQFALQFIIYAIIINFILAFFNMLPIYPLDGFRLLSMYLKPGNRYAAFMYKYGLYVLFGVIIVGRFFSSLNIPFLDIFGTVYDLIYKLIMITIKAAGVGA